MRPSAVSRPVFIFCVLVLMLLTSIAPTLARAAAPPLAPRDNGQLSVHIQQLVPNGYNQLVVYVSVIGADGHPVAGLSKDQVSATVDGKPVKLQELTEVTDVSQPITAAVLLDTSGSMAADNKLQAAKDAIKSFSQSLNDQDRVALYQVAGDGPSGVKRILNFTTNHKQLEAAIDPLRAAGNTPIYDALYQVAQDMASITGRKLVILQTDGVDDSSQHSLYQALQLAEQVHLPIYTIGLGTNADVESLQLIAHDTSGTFFSDPDPTQLRNSYQTILSQLRDSYRLILQTPGAFLVGRHRVQVQVSYQGRVYTDPKPDDSNPPAFWVAPTKMTLKFSLPEGARVSGTASMTLEVQGDALPMRSVNVTIDGKPFATLRGGGPQFKLPVWNLRYVWPGAHTIHLTVTDVEGNTASLDRTVYVGIEWSYWIGLLMDLLLILLALVVLRYAYYRFLGGKLEGILIVRNAADQRVEIELGHDVQGSRMRLRITERGVLIGAHPPWKRFRFTGPEKPLPEGTKLTKKGRKVKALLFIRKERVEAGAPRIPVAYYLQKGKKKPAELRNGMSKKAGNYRVEFTD